MNWPQMLWRTSLLGLGTAGTYVAGTVAGVVNVPDLADPKTLACIIRDEAQFLTGERAPPPETGVRVLVARLELDKDGRQTRHVAESLRGTGGFEVQPLCRTLALGEDRDLSQAMSDATAKGRRWLDTRGGAILVWGQVEQEDKSVRLRLLTADSETADQFLTLADDLRLPKNYGPSLSVVLAASVLSQTLTLTQSSGGLASDYVGDRLKPLLPQLRNLAEGAGTLSEKQGDTAREAYLSALITLSSQTGDVAFAEEAQGSAERALTELPRSRAEARTSVAYWRARALHHQGSRKADIGLLEEAERSYSGLFSVWTEKAAPESWARAQLSRASVLRRLGTLKDEDRLIESALETQKDVLRVFTKDKAPLDWARAQSGLARSYAMLGERRRDATLLEQAASAYEAALSARKREEVPLAWAASQTSLANVLTDLGKLRRDPVLLGRAVAGYRSALEVRRRDKLPLAWASSQDNLGQALVAAGLLDRDAAKLRDGVAAFRAALEVRTRESVPGAFADASLHLGSALLATAAIEPGRALYEEAAAHLSAALAVYEEKGPKSGATEAREKLAQSAAKLKAPGEG